MNRFVAWCAVLAITGLVMACGSSSAAQPAPTASATLTPSPTATASPTATPAPMIQDVLAERLVIPSLNLDAPVQKSETVPYTYTPPAGCPGEFEDTTTVTVPDSGIATPADALDGLENKIWIFGHSRFQGTPGLFHGLEDLKVGDKVYVDGVDRTTSQAITNEQFVVNGIYLADTDSGGSLLNSSGPDDIPARTTLVLQTSVRERGQGAPWLLDQGKLLAGATNIVKGDLDDPCKYLLLFVTAESSS
ncbi:MAG TPA: sortase [Dehalococcoidia bacterium]|nr:sortase [Dehalococcoidia bacterium]